MAPCIVSSALHLTRDHRPLAKSSALYREPFGTHRIVVVNTITSQTGQNGNHKVTVGNPESEMSNGSHVLLPPSPLV